MSAARRPPPERLCPDCGTAELTRGREVCQACALLRTLREPLPGQAELPLDLPGQLDLYGDVLP